MEYFLSLIIVASFPLYVLYRNTQLLKPTAMLCAIAFLGGTIWDYIAISRGWWSYNDAFLLGPKFLGIPLEDYLFFIVTPVAAIAWYHIVKTGKI